MLKHKQQLYIYNNFWKYNLPSIQQLVIVVQYTIIRVLIQLIFIKYKRKYMDFEDQMPCGGYEQEDQQIKQSMTALSLNTKPQKKQCNQSCLSCQCNSKVEAKQEQNITKSPLCKKCKINKSVLLHKNQPICKDCLFKNIQYKCRLYLENKIKVRGTDNLLVCFSGGLNSICLVNIILNLRKRYQKSPLFGQIKFLHIQQQNKIDEEYLKKFEQQTGQPLHILKIEDIYQRKQNQSFQNVVSLFSMFKQSGNTNDLLEIFRNRLIRKFAEQNNSQNILFGNNGENMAYQIFRNFTKGKGGNIADMTVYEPGRIAYPLKEHLQKQLQYYFFCEKLSKLSLLAQEDDLSNIVSKSVDNYLENFVTNLQSLFSHTAPAIVRTGQKLDHNRKNDNTCVWCSDKGVFEKLDNKLCLRCLRIKQAANSNYNVQKLPQWMK